MTPSPDQKRICSEYGAELLPSPPDMKIGIAKNVLDRLLPINGLRHPPVGDTTGISGLEKCSRPRTTFSFPSTFLTWSSGVLKRSHSLACRPVGASSLLRDMRMFGLIQTF